MKVIGITGGVGCGKSEVLSFLEENYDCIAIRTDLVARALMEHDGVCFAPVVALFGQGVVGEDGEFDRKKIAEVVFNDKEALEKLNAITHPAVKDEVKRLIAEAAKNGREFVFLESALLLEEKYDEICDDLWYVYAEVRVREERLMKSRGYSVEKTHSVMSNQLSEDIFRSACHFVLDNSGDFGTTKQQIIEKMSGYSE